jgi:hypothetical protein
MDLRIGELGAEPADIPRSPPPEVLRDVEAAGRRAQKLWKAGCELHFEVGRGRVVVQIRDLDGTVLRTIGPSEALDILSGRGV